MPYKITNSEKKDVSDKTYWMKTLHNGKKIYLEDEVWYRWGEVIVEDDPRENGWKEGEPLVAGDFNITDHNLNASVHVYQNGQKLIDSQYSITAPATITIDANTHYDGSNYIVFAINII